MAKEFIKQENTDKERSTDNDSNDLSAEHKGGSGGSTSGGTGDLKIGRGDEKMSFLVEIVHKVFVNHSEKLFAITALIGFTLVFYSGNIKEWSDFCKYTAFLGVVLLFYIILSMIEKKIGKKIEENIGKKIEEKIGKMIEEKIGKMIEEKIKEKE